MKNKEIIAEIKKEFPKHNKAAFSMAMRTEETGVQLCDRAKAIYRLFNSTEPRRSECRTKGIRFACRLTESDAEAVRAAMEKNGILTQQELVESLLIWFVRTSDKKRASVCGGTHTEADARG